MKLYFIYIFLTFLHIIIYIIGFITKKKQVEKTNTYHGVIFGPAVLQQYTEPFSSYLRMR